MSKQNTPTPTANDTTGTIVKFLNLRGFTVWRQNTTGIYDATKGVWRKNPNNKKGVADIIGFDNEGRFVAVEVKAGSDRLSPEQTHFLNQVKRRRGVIGSHQSKRIFLIRSRPLGDWQWWQGVLTIF